MDSKFYKNVLRRMLELGVSPGFRKTVIVNNGEWLPIISAECELWAHCEVIE